MYGIVAAALLQPTFTLDVQAPTQATGWTVTLDGQEIKSGQTCTGKVGHNTFTVRFWDGDAWRSQRLQATFESGYHYTLKLQIPRPVPTEGLA